MEGWFQEPGAGLVIAVNGVKIDDITHFNKRRSGDKIVNIAGESVFSHIITLLLFFQHHVLVISKKFMQKNSGCNAEREEHQHNQSDKRSYELILNQKNCYLVANISVNATREERLIQV